MPDSKRDSSADAVIAMRAAILLPEVPLARVTTVDANEQPL